MTQNSLSDALDRVDTSEQWAIGRDGDAPVELDHSSTEQMEDAIRAAGFKLAAALPVPEEAHGLVRSLSVYELALRLPDWASQVTRRRQSFVQDPAHLLRQVCKELEGPIEQLELKTNERSHGNMDLEGLRYADDVRSASRRLRRLTNDLLDLASISGGDFEVAQLKFQLRDCVSAALVELRMQAQQQHCVLRVAVGPEVPSCLVGDPGRLRQVVRTLVGNALSRSQRDEIRLSFRAELERDRAVLLHGSVARIDGFTIAGLKRRQRDSGPVSWRGDASTGLELAISRKLVAQMGGRTWVEGTPDGGSLLHFTVRCELAGSMPERTPLATTRLRPRVLLAATEDEPISTLQDRLRSLNATVIVAHDGEEAIRVVQHATHPFDAIVLVASLTARSGSALAELLGGLTPRPPIMLVTRKGHRGDATRCRGLGIAAYLPQPVSRRDLEDTLLELATAGGQTGSADERRPGLITRHFLRETRRSQQVRVIGNAPDVVATLLDLGHQVVDSAAPSSQGADLVLIDVSDVDAQASELVAEAMTSAGATSRVLALVRDPTNTSLQVNARLSIVARHHEPLALQEALGRLRDTGETGPTPTYERANLGPTVWPGIVERAGGDQALAQTMARVFFSHAPAWLTDISQVVRNVDVEGDHLAFRQLHTSLVALGLRGSAELCKQLEGAHRGRQPEQATLLLLELNRQIHKIISRMRTSLDRRRYSGSHRD